MTLSSIGVTVEQGSVVITAANEANFTVHDFTDGKDSVYSMSEGPALLGAAANIAKYVFNAFAHPNENSTASLNNLGAIIANKLFHRTTENNEVTLQYCTDIRSMTDVLSFGETVIDGDVSEALITEIKTAATAALEAMNIDLSYCSQNGAFELEFLVPNVEFAGDAGASE